MCPVTNICGRDGTVFSLLVPAREGSLRVLLECLLQGMVIDDGILSPSPFRATYHLLQLLLGTLAIASVQWVSVMNAPTGGPL